jgi:cytochrome c-type biogenesis protein
MDFSLALAFLAGIVTVLSPCVLPLLSVIFASAVQEGRWQPWGVLIGFVASFALVTLSLATAVNSLGLQPEAVRTFSGVLLLALGTLLVVPRFGHWFEVQTSGVAVLSATLPSGDGFAGGLALGGGLGLVWTPCVGPIMASVITLALNQEVTLGAVAVTLAFALGTALPMAGVIFGGRALVRRLSFFQEHAERIRQVFGLLLVLAALLILIGFDRAIQGWLLVHFPGWEAALTGWETAK